MTRSPAKNPLLRPILDSFEVKRIKSTGLVPANWLLAVLCILDAIQMADRALEEDDIYTYDYSLKGSRTGMVKTLEKYGLPVRVGIGKEGVTKRGAPGLRMFRAMNGGKEIMGLPKEQRDRLILEAVDLVRIEIDRNLSLGKIQIALNDFENAGSFVLALLKNTHNRSGGRVEQALVGAKLHLRFPKKSIVSNPGFAGDKQTGREADYEFDNIRVLVSVSPKADHFDAAIALAKLGRQIFLIVSERRVAATKKTIAARGFDGTIVVSSVSDYVKGNMMEIAGETGMTAREMCLRLAREYNSRISIENECSLQVELPD
ncbi:MAG: DUF4928 family protein [Planctomycetaceae bacterium]|nr:DUF4928 family protein [Planctomycetaceae bacterium]